MTCASMPSLFLTLLVARKIRGTGYKHWELSPQMSRKSRAIKAKSERVLSSFPFRVVRVFRGFLCSGSLVGLSTMLRTVPTLHRCCRRCLDVSGCRSGRHHYQAPGPEGQQRGDCQEHGGRRLMGCRQDGMDRGEQGIGLGLQLLCGRRSRGRRRAKHQRDRARMSCKMTTPINATPPRARTVICG